jgi:hypothetical protein
VKHLLNFLAVVLLVATIATPIYFAKNFANIAGVKSTSKYLVVSQIEKFPNLTFSQNQDKYRISFTKYGDNQAFLEVLIINNPTKDSQTYELDVTSGDAKVFFGQNLNDQKTKVTVPSQASVPISLISSGLSQTQEVEFRVTW